VTKPFGSVTTFLREHDAGVRAGATKTPCGTCTACCVSKEWAAVPLSAEEAERFADCAHYSAGTWLLDRKPDGSCVKLIEGKCSVYQQRPRTCRLFDCRWAALIEAICRFGVADELARSALLQWEAPRITERRDRDALEAIARAIMRGGKPKTTVEAMAKSASMQQR
jgi:Fe-S-cluster containining protein